jgi:hypothetical protein
MDVAIDDGQLGVEWHEVCSLRGSGGIVSGAMAKRVGVKGLIWSGRGVNYYRVCTGTRVLLAAWGMHVRGLFFWVEGVFMRGIRVLGLMAAGLVAGCGLAALPSTIAMNASFSFHGVIVDSKGARLDGVTCASHVIHPLAKPISGRTTAVDDKLRRHDGTFEYDVRGSDVTFTFKKDGYLDREYRMKADDENTVIAPEGEWPNAGGFPVVMQKAGAMDERLITWQRDIDYKDYPHQRAVKIDARSKGFLEIFVDAEGENMNDVIFLTLKKEPPRALNPKGDVDPTEVNLPGSITLNVKGKDAGFVRIETKLGYAPIQTSDEAPATDYAPQLTINRDRLKEMRAARQERIMEGKEYFFFRAAGHYGKGEISWTMRMPKEGKKSSRTDWDGKAGTGSGDLRFNIALYMQREVNDPTLTIRMK